MSLRPLFTLAGLAALALLPLTRPSLAATARASDPISIFAGPHSDEQIVGRLAAGETVTIDTCTASGRWCRVLHDGPTGWVPGSYLVGAAAKIDATPLRSLTDPPVKPERHDNMHSLW